MSAHQLDLACTDPYAVFPEDSGVSDSDLDEAPIVLNGELGLDQ